MTRRLTALLAIFYIFFSTCRADKTDSLKQVLHTEIPDTSRIKALNELAMAYETINLDSALAFAYESLSYEKRYPNFHGTGRAHFVTGFLLSVAGRYSEQVKHLYSARVIFEKNGNVKDQIRVYLQLGGLFFNLKIFDQASHFWGLAEKMADESGDMNFKATVLNNLGCMELERLNYDAAMNYFNEALAIPAIRSNFSMRTFLMLNMGETYTALEKYDTARQWLTQAEHLADSLNMGVTYASVCIGRGTLENNDNHPREAIHWFHAALSRARSLDGLPEQEKALRGLAESFILTGNSDSGAFYYSLHETMRDSLDKLRTMADLSSDLFNREQAIEDARRKIDEKSLQMELEEESRRNREIRTWYLAGAVVMLAGITFLFFRYRANKRMAADMELMVKERTGELNTFVYQSTHEMRSPLTSILGLGQIALNENEDKNKYIHLILDRAQHLDRVHSELIHSMNIRERKVKREPVALAKLTQGTIAEVQRLRNQPQAEFRMMISAKEHISTDPWLLGQILRTVLLNAVDFSQPGRNASIRIEAMRENGKIKISIEDNGTGMKAENVKQVFEMFRRGSLQGKGAGLGLYNARIATRMLEGQISLESEEGKGTKVTVEIPA